MLEHNNTISKKLNKKERINKTMKIQNSKQIVRKFGKDDRYNTCPRCGREVYLYVDEQGEYNVGCVNCDADNTAEYRTYVPNEDELDICRILWNTTELGKIYSPAALNEMNVQNGEYVVTNVTDGFIVFAGDQDALFDFLSEKSRMDKQRMYVIRSVLNGKLVNIGISLLVDLALKHYKVER